MLPVVAIIGRPNVGKSTLFNRITGSGQAITADLAGTTRDRLYGKVAWNREEFVLVDTAGIETGAAKDSVYAKLDTDVQEQVTLAIEEADLLLFVTDATVGITDQDRNALKVIYKSGKDFILVVNKYDSEKLSPNVSDFFKLGVKDFIPISALTGRNTGDLMDKIASRLKTVDRSEKNISLEIPGTKVAIAGRPNVGKSSLFNALIGKNRAIVSEVSGTTRDFTIGTLAEGDESINFIDTAGIRRRGKVGKMPEGKTSGQIEKYSVLRSFKAIENADIVLVMIDAVDGVTAQDLHVAGFAKDQLKGIILVVNKWDAVEKDEKDMSKFLHYLETKINFLGFAPVIFVSAVTHKNIDKIPQIISQVANNRSKRIPTNELNLLLGEDILKKSPPAKRGILPKINYVTEADVNPPTFVFFSNHPELIHFSYSRYLENKIREHWDFTGTPINIVFRRKNINNRIKGKK
jgi:GTP-binding protein